MFVVENDRQTALLRVNLPDDFDVGRHARDRIKLREDPTEEEGLTFRNIGRFRNMTQEMRVGFS